MTGLLYRRNSGKTLDFVKIRIPAIDLSDFAGIHMRRRIGIGKSDAVVDKQLKCLKTQSFLSELDTRQGYYVTYHRTYLLSGHAIGALEREDSFEDNQR